MRRCGMGLEPPGLIATLTAIRDRDPFYTCFALIGIGAAIAPADRLKDVLADGEFVLPLQCGIRTTTLFATGAKGETDEHRDA